MEFEDEGLTLAARPLGETGALAEVLTREHGRFAAFVAGGGSRRLRAALQPGARVRMAYRSRLSEQLGSARLEASGEGAAALFDDPAALAALAAACALAAAALPEREPHPGAFHGLCALIEALAAREIWPAVYVSFELGLLAELGFALDLSRCALTGVADDLAYVSPRTGRAVSAAAAGPWREKLLRLPHFLLSSQGGLGPGDVEAGLLLTGHFLQALVFAHLDRPLPAARLRLIELLAEGGRL